MAPAKDKEMVECSRVVVAEEQCRGSFVLGERG